VKNNLKGASMNKKTADTPSFGQYIPKGVKYADKQSFELAKRKVLRDFDRQLRSLAKR
jgi:hypothetical protein